MGRSARTRRTNRKAIPKRCWRAKGAGKEAKLSYSGNLLVENRNGLIVSSLVWEATGTAERDAAMVMLGKVPGIGRVTVGGDKGFDTADFVRECRNMGVTPHVAQNLGRRGGSAIDGRTTRHAGYRISQKKRKRIEECFGWLKTIALLRKVRHRGTLKVDWMFTFACAAYMALKPSHGALGSAKNNPKNRYHGKMTQTRAEIARSTQFFSSLLGVIFAFNWLELA